MFVQSVLELLPRPLSEVDPLHEHATVPHVVRRASMAPSWFGDGLQRKASSAFQGVRTSVAFSMRAVAGKSFDGVASSARLFYNIS